MNAPGGSNFGKVLLFFILLVPSYATAGPLGPWNKSDEVNVTVEVETSESVSANMKIRVEQACRELISKRRRKGMQGSTFHWRIRVEQSSSSSDFLIRTGLNASFAAASVGTVLWLSPPRTLRHVGDLQKVFRHECAHLWLRAQGIPSLPLVVEEAVASGLASWRTPEQNAPCKNMDPHSFAAQVSGSPSPKKVRTLYTQAHACVWPLISHLDDEKLLPFLRKIAADPAHWADVKLASSNVAPFASLRLSSSLSSFEPGATP